MQLFLNFFLVGSYGLDVVSILVGLSFLYLGFHFRRAYDRAQEHDALILNLNPDQTWLLNSMLNARGFVQHLGKMGLSSLDTDKRLFAKLYRAYFENLGAAGYRLFYHSDDFPEELSRILSKNFADQCHLQVLHEVRHDVLKDYAVNKVNVQDLYKINDQVVIAKIQVDAVICQINSKKIIDLRKLVDEDGKVKAEIDDLITPRHNVWTDYVVFGRTDNWQIYNIGNGTAYRSDDGVDLISMPALGDTLLKAVTEHNMDTGLSFDWKFLKAFVILLVIFAFGVWLIEHTPDAPVWLNVVCFISCMLGVAVGLGILMWHAIATEKQTRY